MPARTLLMFQDAQLEIRLSLETKARPEQSQPTHYFFIIKQTALTYMSKLYKLFRKRKYEILTMTKQILKNYH